MKELNRIQNFIFVLGAFLILVGALMCVTRMWISPYIYSVGAVCFSSMQLLASYEGTNFVIKRLRRQQIIAVLLLLIAAIPMFMTIWKQGFAQQNEWVLCLTIAAVVELYTAFRIPAELEKESRQK
ncbi:MAG: hypothetical protein RR386_00015 [Bacteroidaceae bacterium]